MRNVLANIEKRAGSSDHGAAAFRGLSILPKVAAVDDRANETDEESRLRRVGEFLRRRAPSGLLNGSASPTPPKDTTP
jgi:hypothetical protein